MSFTRELLYDRHRLSHPQIDSWIGKSEQGLSLDEKLQEMALISEFIAITDAFVAAGLNFTSLKGPLLSYRLYGDATCRRYHDFDFLLTISDTEIAYKILLENGYLLDYFKIPEDDNSKKKFFKHIKDISLYNSEKDICIELHWKLFSGRFVSSNQLAPIISSNLSEISFAGRTFTVLNPELDLLYLVIHGGLHCFFRLKWLIDIKDFIEKVPFDAGKFEQLTQQLNASRMVALCNEVLKVYFPDSKVLPGNYKVNNYLFNFTLEKIESENEENISSFKDFVRYHRFTLSAFPGWRYKISHFHFMIYQSYIVNSKKSSSNPYSFIFTVPFQTLVRWMKRARDAKPRAQNDDL